MIALDPHDVVRRRRLDQQLVPREAGAVDDRRVHVGVLTAGRRGERAVGPIAISCR